MRDDERLLTQRKAVHTTVAMQVAVAKWLLFKTPFFKRSRVLQKPWVTNTINERTGNEVGVFPTLCFHSLVELLSLLREVK